METFCRRNSQVRERTLPSKRASNSFIRSAADSQCDGWDQLRRPLTAQQARINQHQGIRNFLNKVKNFDSSASSATTNAFIYIKPTCVVGSCGNEWVIARIGLRDFWLWGNRANKLLPDHHDSSFHYNLYNRHLPHYTIVPRFCKQRAFLLLCHKKQRLMKKSWKLRRTSFFPIWTFCCRGCRCPGLGLASADLERARKLIQWVKKERMERRCNCFKKEWVFGVFASMRVWMCVWVCVCVDGRACLSCVCECVCGWVC